MTVDHIRDVVSQIRYKGWAFRVVAPPQGNPYLQVAFVAPDNDTDQPTVQRGRKWMLSHHMTVSEIVSTALKAVLTAEEHEAREQFTYRGATIFGPHVDVETLVTIAESKDRRQPA